jgi:hypothetical protein
MIARTRPSFAFSASVALLFGVVATAGTASAESLRLTPTSDVGLSLGRADDAPPPQDADAARIPWGERGCIAWTIQAGYADDFNETSIVPASIGISWFPIRMLSFDVQAEGLWFSQDVPAGVQGDSDVLGGGAAFLLRWHFLEFGDEGGLRGSIYGDVGVGFVVTGEDVPPDTSQFNFTPRAGVGASFAIDDYSRVLMGVRWFHVSNAQTASNNPGIDALQVYAGLSFAF